MLELYLLKVERALDIAEVGYGKVVVYEVSEVVDIHEMVEGSWKHPCCTAVCSHLHFLVFLQHR